MATNDITLIQQVASGQVERTFNPSLSANFVPKFIATGLSRSIISDNGSTASVSGALSATSIQNTPIGSTTANTGAFTTLTATGNVAIGTSVNSLYGLNHAPALSGDGTQGVRLVPAFTSTANNQSFYSLNLGGASSIATGTSTGLVWYGLSLGTPSVTGTGTIGTAYQLYINTCPTATTKYAIYQNGSGDRNFFNGGVELGAPTGGNKGSGTLNAAGDIYKNNTAYTNPDYVLEHWATGKIEKFADKDYAKEYDGLRPLSEVESFIRTNWHLPRFGQNANHGIFSGSDALLASVEEAYLYILQLEKRILTLEKKLQNS